MGTGPEGTPTPCPEARWRIIDSGRAQIPYFPDVSIGDGLNYEIPPIKLATTDKFCWRKLQALAQRLGKRAAGHPCGACPCMFTDRGFEELEVQPDDTIVALLSSMPSEAFFLLVGAPSQL